MSLFVIDTIIYALRTSVSVCFPAARLPTLKDSQLTFLLPYFSRCFPLFWFPFFSPGRPRKKDCILRQQKKRQDRNRVTTKSNRHVLIIWLTLIRLSLQKSTFTIWDHMFNIVTWRTKYHTDQQLFPQSYTVLIIALNIIKPAMFIYLSIIKLNYHYPSIIIFLVAKLVKIVYCVDQMTKHFKSFLPIIVPCWLFDCIWLEGVGVPNRDPFALPKRCCKYPCESRQSWDLEAPFYQMVVL